MQEAKRAAVFLSRSLQSVEEETDVNPKQLQKHYVKLQLWTNALKESYMVL